MSELNEYRIKKNLEIIKGISLSTKEAAITIADACYALAHQAREYDSTIKANERNLAKNKDQYKCNGCGSTFTSDFHRCPECVKGYITLSD